MHSTPFHILAVFSSNSSKLHVEALQTFTQPLWNSWRAEAQHTHRVKQWFKSTLLFIKATLRTKKVACQNLFSRRHRATNCCFSIETSLQFRVLLPLSTCYFHFKKGTGKCGAVRVKTNPSLIYLLNIQCDYRWKLAADSRLTSMQNALICSRGP